jgi:hypothetical protein
MIGNLLWLEAFRKDAMTGNGATYVILLSTIYYANPWSYGHREGHWLHEVPVVSFASTCLLV